VCPAAARRRGVRAALLTTPVRAEILPGGARPSADSGSQARRCAAPAVDRPGDCGGARHRRVSYICMTPWTRPPQARSAISVITELPGGEAARRQVIRLMTWRGRTAAVQHFTVTVGRIARQEYRRRYGALVRPRTATRPPHALIREAMNCDALRRSSHVERSWPLHTKNHRQRRHAGALLARHTAPCLPRSPTAHRRAGHDRECRQCDERARPCARAADEAYLQRHLRIRDAYRTVYRPGC
jgi:hypothetical protein